jgi:signal transduction histidine kinase
MLRNPRRPARLDDYHSAPGPLFTRDRFGVGSSVSVPILVDDRLWGMLGVITEGRPLPPDTEVRLQQFAELIAAALANTQAQAKMRQLADEQTALRRVAELVAQSAPLDQVFTAIAAEASKLLGDLGAVLTRFDPDGFGTVVAACNSTVPIGMRMPSADDTASGRVLRSGRTARVASFDGTDLANVAVTFQVGAVVAVPITVGGRIWAALLALSPRKRDLPSGTEERLEEFAALAAAAIANAENKENLTASRARVVATADETRRRIQRDVHDGAQQRLVQTVITLKVALDAAANGRRTTELIGEALYHAQRATRELRELVHGILPASLNRDGLRAGIESLIADFPTPVSLDLVGPRLSAETETTAFFIVAEALTNVVKHANATRADVRIKVDGTVLTIEISDDGSGGADPIRGTGLTGLGDRVGAAGGTLEITSPPGAGTTLRAELPATPIETPMQAQDPPAARS